MSKSVTIVMYHYVRELAHTRYPGINGLSTAEFIEQIGYIKKYYHVISADEFMEVIDSDSRFPPKALLLTFDDGYIDHYTNVFPILDRYKLPACFFPLAKCILEGRVLDVNKIHFILASVENKEKIVEYIMTCLDRFRPEHGLEPNDLYWKKIGKPNRFDTAEVIFIKRMLQRELPEPIRKIITDGLFEKYVTADEVAFSKEIYMSIDQVSCMYRHGMYFGSHGYDHYWLDTLSEAEQTREIDMSLDFLRRAGVDVKKWIMCYPYGAFNETLLSILRLRNCIAGLTTQVAMADLKKDNPLTLPRLDTNDLPKQTDAPPNEWTEMALGEGDGRQ